MSIFIYPGHVVSSNDGDRHYITAPQLAHLYGVDTRECIVVTPINHSRVFAGRHKKEDDIHLYPREDGKYIKLEKHND